MGNAIWTGVPLGELLELAGVRNGSVQVQFQGLKMHRRLPLERRTTPRDQRLPRSWYFATYWTKCLTWILDKHDVS